jgi:hypothetical protein
MFRLIDVFPLAGIWAVYTKLMALTARYIPSLVHTWHIPKPQGKKGADGLYKSSRHFGNGGAAASAQEKKVRLEHCSGL